MDLVRTGALLASMTTIACILIICVTCVVLTCRTGSTAGLQDFAAVIRAWRRKSKKDDPSNKP